MISTDVRQCEIQEHCRLYKWWYTLLEQTKLVPAWEITDFFKTYERKAPTVQSLLSWNYVHLYCCWDIAFLWYFQERVYQKTIQTRTEWTSIKLFFDFISWTGRLSYETDKSKYQVFMVYLWKMWSTTLLYFLRSDYKNWKNVFYILTVFWDFLGICSSDTIPKDFRRCRVLSDIRIAIYLFGTS